MYHTTNNLLLTFSLFLCMPTCFAERSDRDMPLHLESDQVVIDDMKKFSTFSGNVQMTQGSMLIRGDKVIVTKDKNGFKHGTVYGNSATFRQKREGLDEYVEGSAERIEYDMRSEIADFYVQARVKRGRDEVRGDHITYNVKTEVFQVSGGAASSVGTSPKRVRAVLQPKPKQGSVDPSSPDSIPANPGNPHLPAE